MVFLLRSTPETTVIETYLGPNTAETHLSMAIGSTPSLLQTNDTEGLFAMQEVHRLRCLRDLQQRLIHDFTPFFEASNGRVVLMDVALHSNLGDNILWKAAVQLIARFGVSPKLICYVSQKGFMDHIDKAFQACDMTKIKALVKGGGLVLLHAGGNWGDLYRCAILSSRNECGDEDRA